MRLGTRARYWLFWLSLFAVLYALRPLWLLKEATSMALPGETLGNTFDIKVENGMAATCVDCRSSMPIEVLRSAAGYYIGTFCPQCGPYSRESEYFRTRQEAVDALQTGDWAPR